MLLTITTTHKPATDLGFLLYKNPSAVQTFDLSFGQAHVFYPEAGEERCTAALLLDIDPVTLVRGKQSQGSSEGLLQQYVNDRPYVASSFMSVALAQVFSSALNGKSRERPELVEQPIPLEVFLTSVPSKGGEPFLRGLFEPLGYTVELERTPLDAHTPEWGDSRYFNLRLKITARLKDVLNHIYVLIPVLDNDKHYYIGQEEVEKLLKRGEGWLAAHPEAELITKRYLLRKQHLTRLALAQIVAQEQSDPDAQEVVHAQEEEVVERRISLNEERLGSVIAVLRQAGARRVVDLGCGEGRLIKRLLEEKDFEQILGVDVSYRVLEVARNKLRLERMPEQLQNRIKLLQGSLTYRDDRLKGFDAATLIEVIEHLDLPRLAALERVIFEYARPRTVVCTTPNSEYNVRFETLPAGQLRHRDHRFEWTREEFKNWATATANRHGYNVRFLPVGNDDPEVGPPTQMGVFTL